MGLDFTALIHYDGPVGDALQAIRRLEDGELDPALAEVVACGLRHDFAFAKYAGEPAYWRSAVDWEHRLACRPDLPTLEACIELPSDFTLTFGKDTVGVSHTLRWIFFVTDPEWQCVMCAAVGKFCELLGARDCIVTNDGHPAIQAFLGGASFGDALRRAEEQGEGEVAGIGDLYVENGYAENLAFVGSDDQPIAIPIWDTHGYWRFKPMTSQAAPRRVAVVNFKLPKHSRCFDNAASLKQNKRQ